MGMDLDFIIGDKRFNFKRDYRIFGQMSSGCDEATQILFPKKLPADHPKHAMEDGYSQVQYLTAGEIKEKLQMPSDANVYNLGIKAYVQNLPDEEIVILFWH
jgi:hypothetical protein